MSLSRVSYSCLFYYSNINYFSIPLNNSNLTRPDVYIFDDIMSALDGKIGAFISEETIMKQLKGKTVILVTHGLQYLRHADYIYVMDEGNVKQEGSFEDIKDTELYHKFQELENVSNYWRIEYLI